MMQRNHRKNKTTFLGLIGAFCLFYLGMPHLFAQSQPSYNKLFTVIGGQDAPVINKGMPGTTGIQGGFEGGRCIKIGNTYHLFPTERAGEKGMPASFDRIKTRIGHWISKDAIHWKRVNTLYQSDGKYAVSDYDNPANDRRAAIWSFMPVFSKKNNKWNAFYVAYTVSKTIAPNHSFGRIWHAVSEKPGINGIGGPYTDSGIVIEPGLNSQLWEGRQGVQSFFPFKVGEKWFAFYGGAYPWHQWSDYPYHGHKGWNVGLATSGQLEGPWKRMDTSINPITSINPVFVENPIVSKLPNGIYIAIFDGGPNAWGLHLPNKMAFTLSKDGLHWSKARYIDFTTKVKRWWDIMRTPLCLIPEGNNVYTVLYAAIIKDQRFHPIGMVQLKLNQKVLREMTKTLKD